MTFSVYIVQCADASLYTGVAKDVARRIDEHNGLTATGTKSKRGARYTAARRPVTLVYTAALDCRSSAQKEEARLKRLNRSEKLALIAEQRLPRDVEDTAAQDPGDKQDAGNIRRNAKRRTHPSPA
jgi:putative endonuclease